ncbi:MAG: gephyrin-like molybdotransferase Glp [Candidatus Korobacteraceae bacterium]|jgi:molybdopterin molybdotransferase
MPSFEEARRIILDRIRQLPSESVGLLESLGRVTAEDVVAPWNLPSCDNAAMDGYAVRWADCQQPASLRITGFVPAGAVATSPVDAGCAMKIMTGAPIPQGSDTVVPFEDAEELGNQVRIGAPVVRGQHIRFAGEDVRCGETVIPSGRVIRSAEISMLASCGRALVSVHRKPTVAILSTGDELLEAGEPLALGKVVDSNGMALAAGVLACGAIPAILGIARDNRASHMQKMSEGLKADAFITSAGVSAGERDLVREVLAELGMKQLFRRVDIGPGAPTCFGLRDGKPIFCLPGNPVASMITFEEFVKPALLKMMGHRRVLKPLVRAILQEETRKKPGKIKFLRVRLESVGGKLLAYSSGDQNTGILKTMLMADGWAVLPAERSSFSAGDEVEVHIISEDAEMMEP